MGRDRVSAGAATAEVLGRRITDQAFWHDGRCAWVGATSARVKGPLRAPSNAAALGPTLYSGSAGIALFLAELAARTHEARIRTTAIGGIVHALGEARTIPARRALGLYDGRLGIALAAARVAMALERDDIATRARELTESLVGLDVEGADLMHGAAGTAVGMLALGELTGVSSATRCADGFGASAAAAAGTLPLTGMAHGEAGVAHALLEVAAATGSEPARDGALRAIAHEHAQFDQFTGNWPDHRPVLQGEDAELDAGAASAMGWCHGAPGVILSRRRSPEVVGDLDRADVTLAEASVARWLRAALATRPGNLSLCHGLCGVAESLWEATDSDEGHALAVEVAAYGMTEFGTRGAPWPCGTATGETPGLMLGLAGIGLFALRLDDPAIPSVLAVGPQGAAHRRLSSLETPGPVERFAAGHLRGA